MPTRPSGGQGTRETSTPSPRSSLTIRVPRGVTTRRETQPGVVPNRHNAIATLDSAPATCTSSCGACSSGTPGRAESRSIVSPMVTTSGMLAPPFRDRPHEYPGLCLQPGAIAGPRAEQVAPNPDRSGPGRDEPSRIGIGDPAGGDERDVFQGTEDEPDVVRSEWTGGGDLLHRPSPRVRPGGFCGRPRARHHPGAAHRG